MVAAYDSLAEVYDLWATADPAEEPTRLFYSRMYAEARSTVVELCVGTGRIALEGARLGAHVVGVDSSRPMLDVLRKRALSEGLSERIEVLHQDVREFSLPRRTDLITCPFRSLGHFTTEDDLAMVFRRCHENLEPGGRFVFDHYVWSEAWSRENDGVPRLMVEPPGGTGGVRIWDLYNYDFVRRVMHCTIRVEELAPDGTIIPLATPQFEFIWLDPEEVRSLAAKAGFAIDSVHGDFAGSPLTSTSTDQVWTLRRRR